MLSKLVGRIKSMNKKEAFIVFLIFLFAFGIRGHLMIYELFFEFDTYFHARMAEYVIQNTALPAYEWMAYYQLDKPTLPAQGAFFWIFTALIYKVFTLGAVYNKELWIGFVKILPALFGALTVVAMYFLGKEMYDRKTGIIMAFFSAVVPAFVYRTMAGQFEEDSLGFLWMVIGFVLLVKALKPQEFNKKTIGIALLSAFFFGLMAWTWQMFLLIPLITLSYAGTMVVWMWFKNEPKEKIFAFVKIIAVTFFVFSVLATVFTGPVWITKTVGTLVQYTPITTENIDRFTQKGSGVLATTVGEENLGFPFWFEKYNALVIFPIIGLFLLPFRALRRNDRFALMLFFWTVITLFMSFHKLKFTFTLGLPLAACGGVLFNELCLFLNGRSPFEKKIAMVSFSLFVLVGAAAASIFMVTKVPTIEDDSGWKETLYWLRDNTPEGSKIFNWWDNGHWISFIGERRPLIDNRNGDFQGSSDYARFFLTDSTEEAVGIVKKYGPDFVVISNSLIDSAGSLGFYAYEITNFSDPRITKFSAAVFKCGAGFDSQAQQKVFTCGPNTLTEGQINTLPTAWVSQPNQLIEQKIPAYVYTTPSKEFLIIANDASNKSFGFRLLLNDPAIQGFEEVFSARTLKVFRVIK
ncbi:MAG: STT3 domain-containing protein [archaeon]|nr:STT3 domain-containing protein [archaeon]